MMRGLTLVICMMVVLAFIFVVGCSKQQADPDDIFPILKATDQANVMKCLANQHTLRSAITMYRIAHNGANPSSLYDLVPRYIRAVPECPSGGAYDYDETTGAVSCPSGHNQ